MITLAYISYIVLLVQVPLVVTLALLRVGVSPTCTSTKPDPHSPPSSPPIHSYGRPLGVMSNN